MANISHMSVSVCLSIREHISGTTREIVADFSHVTCGRGWNLHWRRCDMLAILNLAYKKNLPKGARRAPG